jgi:hypothetical protein
MNSTAANVQKARETALRLAVAALAGIDLAARCALLDLPAPAADGALTLRLFGKTATGFVPSDPSSAPGVTTTERLLLLHYLLCERPVVPTGKLIAFRQLAGGQFYEGPFQARTTGPLVRRLGNDLTALRRNLARFDHELLPSLCPSPADLAARIHALGRIDVTLIYRTGDEEFGPSAVALFDECIKSVFNTEDVVALASRICLGLL